jgi:hypothetical protein
MYQINSYGTIGLRSQLLTITHHFDSSFPLALLAVCLDSGQQEGAPFVAVVRSRVGWAVKPNIPKNVGLYSPTYKLF